jgi:hypothetical protein
VSHPLSDPKLLGASRRHAPLAQTDFARLRGDVYRHLVRTLATAGAATGERWALELCESGIALLAGMPGVLVPDIDTAVAEAARHFDGSGMRSPSAMLLAVAELVTVQGTGSAELEGWILTQAQAATRRPGGAGRVAPVAIWSLGTR